MILFGLMFAAILYLGLRLFFLKRSIRQAKQALEEISQEIEENRVVKLSVPEKNLEGFLEIINQNLHVIRRQRQEYQQKELALKEQVENISHDLRTPLTALIGYLKMMNQENMDEELKTYLTIAIKKSYTLQNLISSFYELSRITAEDFSLTLEPVDAVRILKEACLDNYSLFEERNLEIQIPPLEGGMFILGNAQALERIFTNLIQNSIRYAKSQLKIRILQERETQRVTIQFSNDINPEQKVEDPEKLFGRFYVQELSRSSGGTGLGLTISRHLAEQMNGSIRAGYAWEDGICFLTVTIQFLLADAQVNLY